jgi:alpha-tubulin suppressor-like RCC1 family protein
MFRAPNPAQRSSLKPAQRRCGTGGRLGHGDEEETLALFTRVQGPLAGVKITSVSLSNDHTVAVADFGGVFAWGCNRDGQLGLGFASAEPVTSPRCIPHSQDV